MIHGASSLQACCHVPHTIRPDTLCPAPGLPGKQKRHNLMTEMEDFFLLPVRWGAIIQTVLLLPGSEFLLFFFLVLSLEDCSHGAPILTVLGTEVSGSQIVFLILQVYGVRRKNIISKIKRWLYRRSRIINPCLHLRSLKDRWFWSWILLWSGC